MLISNESTVLKSRSGPEKQSTKNNVEDSRVDQKCCQTAQKAVVFVQQLNWRDAAVCTVFSTNNLWHHRTRLVHNYNVPTVHFTGLLTFPREAESTFHKPLYHVCTEMHMDESQNASSSTDNSGSSVCVCRQHTHTHAVYLSMLYLIISLQWYWSVVFWSLGVDCSVWDE